MPQDPDAGKHVKTRRNTNVATGTARCSRADHSRTTSPEYKCPSESTLCLSTRDHAPTVATECRQASKSHRQCSTRNIIPALWCQRSNSLIVSAPLHGFCMIPPGHEPTNTNSLNLLQFRLAEADGPRGRSSSRRSGKPDRLKPNFAYAGSCIAYVQDASSKHGILGPAIFTSRGD
jgi:hypothetical protein